MDRGALRATVHGVAKSRTQLSNFHYLLFFQPLFCCVLTHILVSPFGGLFFLVPCCSKGFREMCFNITHPKYLEFPGCTSAKELACQCRKCKRHGSIPGSGSSSGGGHVNPLWYSCLENPMDRRPLRAIVHGAARVRHDWSNLACMHARIQIFIFMILGNEGVS